MEPTPKVQIVPEGLPPDATLTFRPANKEIGDVEASRTMSLPPQSILATLPPSANAEPAPDRDIEPEAAAFELRRVIGRGGFAEVWEAWQASLRRPVALKRLHPDDGSFGVGQTAQVVMQFQQEALTAASLDHPNIVPVYEMGVDAEGRQVLAMKLVRGRPWNDILKIDFKEMEEESYLAKHIPILLNVAQAVAFAHSKGIVHRDLKPSQVMIGAYGEVLLMDWGLAVSTGGASRSSSESRVTALPIEIAGPLESTPTVQHATNPAGTPAYMAPEQTAPTAEGIGTWTDVYLLGGTLYAILTGEPPHSAPTSAGAYAKAITSNVPPPQTITPDRKIPSALAELAMDSLRADPANRPVSVEAFRERLADHLSGETRRRDSVAASEEVRALFDRAGARTYNEHAAALSRLGQALALWPGNPAAASLHARVQESYARAALKNRDLVLAKAQAEGLPESSKARLEIFAEADRLAEQLRRRASQRRALAAVVFALLIVVIAGGTIFTFKVTSERARAQAAEEVALAREKEAKAARVEAEGLLGFMVGDLRESLGPINRLDLLQTAGDKAFDYYANQKSSLRDKSDYMRISTGLSALSTIMSQQGKNEKFRDVAELNHSLMEKANELFPDDRDLRGRLAVARHNTGTAFFLMNDIPHAVERFESAAKIYEELYKADPTDEQWLIGVARAHLTRGDVARRARDMKTTLEEYGRARDLAREFVEGDNKSTTATLRFLENTHRRIGNLQDVMGDSKASETEYAAALAITRKQAEAAPKNVEVMTGLSRAIEGLGDNRNSNGDSESALKYYNEAAGILEALVAQAPGNVDLRNALADILQEVGEALRLLGRNEEALASFERSLALAEFLVDYEPSNTRNLSLLHVAHFKIGQVLTTLQRMDEATAAFQRSIEVAKRSQALDPSEADHRREEFAAMTNIGLILAAQGKYDEALTIFLQAEIDSEEAANAEPENAQAQGDLMAMKLTIPGLLCHVGRVDEAVLLLDPLYARIAALKSSSVGNQAIAAQMEAIVHATAASIWARKGDLPRMRASLDAVLACEQKPTAEMLANDPDALLIRAADPVAYDAFIEKLKATGGTMNLEGRSFR